MINNVGGCLPASYDEIVEASTRNLKVSKSRRIHNSLFKLGKEAKPHVFKTDYLLWDYDNVDCY